MAYKDGVMNEIDDLLSQSLPAVEDGGFSMRVVRRIEAEQMRERMATIVVVAVCAAVVLLFLPVPAINLAIRYLISQLAGSTAVAAAVAAVVLTLAAERQLFRS